PGRSVAVHLFLAGRVLWRPGIDCRSPGRRLLALAPQASAAGGPVPDAGTVPLPRRLELESPSRDACRLRPRMGRPRRAGPEAALFLCLVRRVLRVRPALLGTLSGRIAGKCGARHGGREPLTLGPPGVLQATGRPWIRRMRSTTTAMTSRIWMKPPIV